MYYSNISNKDLLPFHHTLLPNMAITLQETLNNDLFYIEEVGEFLKIIPLFNTTSISSNNPSDKILDNKCIIAQNKPSTYLTFKSNTDDETEEYVPYSEYYSIGDKLNTDQFNGIVQLIRNHIKNNDHLTLKQGLNNGDYGDYEINIDDATIVDNGILITEETLQNTNTITLTNPSFYYSRYILTLTVLEYATPGIGDNTRPETITSTIEIELNKEEPTILPFDDLTVGSVVLFESQVQIDHSTPYIAGFVIDHVDMLEPGPIQKGDTGVLSAFVGDRNDVGIRGMEVSFYEEYILSILLKLSSKIIQKEDVCVMSAELRDAKDGSHVALSGETVLFYLSKGYYPLLDSATVHCESTGANYCYSVGLDELGLDLSSNDFILEFDYSNTVNGGQFCLGNRDSWSSGARAGNNYIYIGTSAANNGGYGVKYNNATDNTSIGSVTAGDTLHCKIIRQGNTVSYYIDDVLKGSKTVDWIGSVSDWSLYLQCWGTGEYSVSNVSLDLEPDLTPGVASVSLSSDKDILSYYDEDSCTLTAIVKNSGGIGVSGESVVFKQGNTVLATETTDGNGVAEYTYESAGAGDVSFTASVGSLVSKIYSIEDCSYYNTNEVSRTTTNGSTIYDNNLSMALPTNCEISYEIWSDNSNTSGEHRYFLLLLSQYTTGTTQPQYALFFDQKGGNNGVLGKRENNSTVALLNNFNCTGSTYHTIKYVKNGTTVEIYVDDELKVTATISWIDNYSDYSLSMMRWSSTGTSKIRNVKFKPL